MGGSQINQRQETYDMKLPFPLLLLLVVTAGKPR